MFVKRESVMKGVYIIPAVIGLVLLSAFVFAAHTVTRVGGGSFSFNEDVTSAVINITINVTNAEDEGMLANVTDVNITIPSTFRFVQNETINSTVSLVSSGYVRNTSTVLIFNNNTYLVNLLLTKVWLLFLFL